MGRNPSAFLKTIGRLLLLLLGAAILGGEAQAQNTNGFPGPNTVGATTAYAEVGNAYLDLQVGIGSMISGSIFLLTRPNNSSDPNGIILNGGLVTTGTTVETTGTNLYIRVDGGTGAQGYDYRFGDTTTGMWIEPPTKVGQHIEAQWETKVVSTTTTGTGNGTTNGVTNYNPNIEVDMLASFVHNIARFQFTVVSNSTGAAHTVGLAFTEDINKSFTALPSGAPLRLPNAPYLHTETLLQGGQIPPYFEVFVEQSPTTLTQPAIVRSIRGTLIGQDASQIDPTPPTRLAYGLIEKLEGIDPKVIPLVFNPAVLWNFMPNTSLNLDTTIADTGVTVYWDPKSIAPNQKQFYVTYVGQSTTDNDFSGPLTLDVSGPKALSYTVTNPTTTGTGTGTTTVTCGSTPAPFVISGYVTNKTDLNGVNATASVNLTLTLPTGLSLADPVNDTLTKQVASINPGAEGSASWNVIVNGKANGTLTYSVSSSPSFGSAEAVSRQIEVPAPPGTTLKGENSSQGLFQMISFPFQFSNTPPSTIFGPQFITSGGTPEFDLVTYNPTLGHYVPVNTLAPGFGYWLRSRLPLDTPIMIDCSKYQPLPSQVLPNPATYTVAYPKGWNQIANPYLYGIRFSEIKIQGPALNANPNDPIGGNIVFVDPVTAADNQYNLIAPVVYRYDTSDPNPNNWQYVLLDNFGFTMQPYDAYWIYVKQDNLKFIYQGTDVTAVNVGAVPGLQSFALPKGSRSVLGANTPTNWRTQITARGKGGMDSVYVGVAPNAADGRDIYKYDKPPVMDGQIQLEITHSDWKGGASLAQDLRSPSSSRKTWDITVHSTRPNDTVTLQWPNLNFSVPHNVRLTLVNTTTNERHVLQNTSSYQVKTGADSTAHIQIHSEPNQPGRSVITAFYIVPSPTRAAGQPPSITIHYALSTAAETHVRIRDFSGKTIRVLTSTTRDTTLANSNSGDFVWDGRNQSGGSTPAGPLNVELEAITQDGQVTRTIQPFNLTR